MEKRPRNFMFDLSGKIALVSGSSRGLGWVGILVFICASIAKIPSREVFRECTPFLIACGIGLLIITYVPAISLSFWRVVGH